MKIALKAFTKELIQDEEPIDVKMPQGGKGVLIVDGDNSVIYHKNYLDINDIEAEKVKGLIQNKEAYVRLDTDVFVDKQGKLVQDITSILGVDQTINYINENGVKKSYKFGDLLK